VAGLIMKTESEVCGRGVSASRWGGKALTQRIHTTLSDFSGADGISMVGL
jgi:hypothetical protein